VSADLCSKKRNLPPGKPAAFMLLDSNSAVCLQVLSRCTAVSGLPKVELKDPHELRSWVNQLRWLSDNAQEASSPPFRRLRRRNGREDGTVTSYSL
jgi:hypothetical protein